jgi:hypothetical protein
MKNSFLIIGVILLLANIAIGLIVSSYNTFNVCMSSAVIIATTLLLWGMARSKMKNGFKIGLSFLFAFLGLMEFVLAILSPEQYKDNWYLIAIIFLIIIESVFVVFSRLTSKH